MKIFTGKVISKKMQKTATVLVERLVLHPIYLKRIKRSKKYHVQDDIGANEGDLVKFESCYPVSKLKKWKIIEIVRATKDKKRQRRKVKNDPI